MRTLLLLPAALLLVSCTADSDTQPLEEAEAPIASEGVVAPAALAEVAATITPEDVHSRIAYLASDSLGGRDTPSPGLEMAAAWAAEEFQRMGLEPGGDEGSFIQRWEYTPRRGPAAEAGPVAVPNVVGLIPGSDPVLRDEWVIFTAHFDHVSGPANDSGDDIYNGADDNASGTAAVMEVAEAFSALPTAPRRSIAFVLVSGEEKGLLGASHFAQGASIPTEAQVADINADMVSRNWPDSIFVFGGEYTNLGPTLDAVVAAHPEIGISIMENRWPQMPLFRMSDHYAFVSEGIPGIFFFSGLHDELHSPDDEVELADTGKAARVARLIFYRGYEVAQADERPQWTAAGQEMLAEMGSGGD